MDKIHISSRAHECVLDNLRELRKTERGESIEYFLDRAYSEFVTGCILTGMAKLIFSNPNYARSKFRNENYHLIESALNQLGEKRIIKKQELFY